MALVVVRDPVTGVAFSALPARRAYLYTEDGSRSFSFDFAPSTIQYKEWGNEWVKVDRVGLHPLLVRKATRLEEISFAINLGGRSDYFEEQNGHLNALQYLATQRARVMFRYSEMEAGLWRITDCTAASTLRHPVTNNPIRATADLTLTRASDPAPGVGPVSAPAPAAAPAPAPARATAPRTVTVGRGDSLWSIAQRAYGNGALWPRIYDANRGKITQPWQIYPGQVLTIP